MPAYTSRACATSRRQGLPGLGDDGVVGDRAVEVEVAVLLGAVQPRQVLGLRASGGTSGAPPWRGGGPARAATSTTAARSAARAARRRARRTSSPGSSGSGRGTRRAPPSRRRRWRRPRGGRPRGRPTCPGGRCRQSNAGGPRSWPSASTTRWSRAAQPIARAIRSAAARAGEAAPARTSDCQARKPSARSTGRREPAGCVRRRANAPSEGGADGGARAADRSAARLTSGYQRAHLGIPGGRSTSSSSFGLPVRVQLARRPCRSFGRPGRRSASQSRHSPASGSPRRSARSTRRPSPARRGSAGTACCAAPRPARRSRSSWCGPGLPCGAAPTAASTIRSRVASCCSARRVCSYFRAMGKLLHTLCDQLTTRWTVLIRRQSPNTCSMKGIAMTMDARPSEIQAARSRGPPGDADWDAARSTFNVLKDQRPEAIAFPADAREVAAAFPSPGAGPPRGGPGDRAQRRTARVARGHRRPQHLGADRGRHRRRGASRARGRRDPVGGRDPAAVRARAGRPPRLLAGRGDRGLLAASAASAGSPASTACRPTP